MRYEPRRKVERPGESLAGWEAMLKEMERVYRAGVARKENGERGWDGTLRNAIIATRFGTRQPGEKSVTERFAEHMIEAVKRRVQEMKDAEDRDG
jgi:hypothetical protein